MWTRGTVYQSVGTPNQCLFSTVSRHTIAERAEELIKCYTKKYKSVLEQKHWTDEELDNLSGNLKKMIRGKVQAKRDIDERLEFLMVVQSMPDLTPDDVWNKYPEGTYTKFKNG